MRDLSFRRPLVADAPALWRLCRGSGQLDENSPYAYLLVCSHFAATSVVAARGGEEEEVVAFASAYRPPTAPEALFVWQIAVDPRARRRGVGRALLEELLELPANLDATHLEATVTASNAASERLFLSFADDHGAACAVSVMFPAEAFPGGGHEAERLFRIGPLPDRQPCPPAPERPRAAPPPTTEVPA
ncbi:MAG: diaminobutyrate acetyltransferase [Actinomycetota bacterium]